MAAARTRVVAAALAAALLKSQAALAHEEAAVDVVAERGLAEDDECGAGDSDGQCSLHALQRRVLRSSQQSEEAVGAVEVQLQRSNATQEGRGIWHYAWNCWNHCGGAGMCEDWCGPGNACCRYLHSGDPPECANIRFWPVRTFHTCVHSQWGHTHAHGGSGAYIYTNPKLYKPSDAPLMDFYLYRVQTNETYDPMDQDLANPGGALWYLHNEIVWHKDLKRSGTYFTTPKTRIERFRIKTRATQPLFDLGMNFGVVNTFDWTKCTGPFKCSNFRTYGYTVGCETWEKDSPSAFPHSQWVGKNVYPGAKWFSLPGPCPTGALGKKTADCMAREPGGKCNGEGDPTGEGNCTFTFEKVGQITIDELEGIADPKAFVASGGQEYDLDTDSGVGNHFWDHKMDVTANKWREERFLQIFKEKYPNLPDLPEPTCDFDKYKFYPGRWR